MLLTDSKEKNQSLEEVTLGNSCDYIGMILKESAIRSTMGVTVLGIRREGELISNPSANEEFKLNDVLIIYGDKESNETFRKKCIG